MLCFTIRKHLWNDKTYIKLTSGFDGNSSYFVVYNLINLSFGKWRVTMRMHEPAADTNTNKASLTLSIAPL